MIKNNNKNKRKKMCYSTIHVLIFIAYKFVRFKKTNCDW